jgi:hypothetical protein
MPIVAINSYQIGWNPKTKTGGVRIKLANGQEISVPVGSADEVSALGVVLNESPVSFNTDNGFIMTPSWEPVGGA